MDHGVFQVKIVSKGRDGYMGVGLSAQGVNMNRLPGWDKHSYGYHGDDGNSFCSSGTGQQVESHTHTSVLAVHQEISMGILHHVAPYCQ